MIDIKRIWDNQHPSGEIIIKTRIDDIQNLKCFAATNHITGQHLFILEVSNSVLMPPINLARFKGVEVYTLVNQDAGCNELYVYLLDNELKDIFALFVQNILEELEVSITESEAITRTLNVVSKWKRLFDKISFAGLSSEQQKGLMGELLFLNSLLDNETTYSNSVRYWTAPELDFRAKDFTLGTLGVEVKFSTSKQPKILISNENQLDSYSLNELYLVLYTADAVKENGVSLNTLVDKTRQKIDNKDECELFNNKLLLYGYKDSDKEHYDVMYSIRKVYCFLVVDQFPRITKSLLPIGVYDTAYSIEISSVEKYIVEFDKIFNLKA